MKIRFNVFGVICAMVALFSAGFISGEAEAAVFRGQNTQSLIELLQLKRLFPVGIKVERYRDTTGDLDESSFFENAEERDARTTTGRKVNYYTTTKQVVPQQKFQDLTVNNVFGFAIKLPEGFDKKADTLTPTSGSVEFKTENTTVKITALGNACEGGPVTIQDCLNKKSDAFTDELRQRFVSGIVQQKEIVKLRDSLSNRFDQENVGKQFIIDVGAEKVAVLTFFDPNMKYLWRMEITAPDNQSGILNQGGVLNRIKESLFVAQNDFNSIINRSKIVTAIPVNNRLRSQSVGRRSNAFSVVSSKDDVVYKAAEVGFQIAVPGSFHETADSLKYDGGEMKFENGEGEIVVISTKNLCVSQTATIVRECIEKLANDFFSELRKENQNMTSLGINNYQLRLTSSMTDVSIARGEVLMNGPDRVAAFLFSEPLYGYVWQMKVISNKGQNGLLGDAQKMKNLLNSMRFMK